MTVVYEAIPDINCVLAIFLTILGAGIGVLLVVLILLATFLEDDWDDGGRIDSFHRLGSSRPRKYTLSNEEILRVVESYRTLERLEEWTCAVCLEGGSTESVSSEDEESHAYLPALNFTMLPCGHLFHERCIETWFYRGGTSCPLCKSIVPI
mmetsp:Transcript_7933/g.15933  ORF Transcript_7933/g.15933 Transcript_7933/m.15933 type:complete len:152 (-) Transcript_7933:1484-1939(-)